MSQYDFVIKHAKRGEKVREIYRHLRVEFGLRAYSVPSVYRIVREFRCSTGKPEEESTRGRPIDTQLVPAIYRVLRHEPYSSVRDIAKTLNSNPATIYRHLTKYMGLVFKHTKWIPHLLLKVQKEKRVHDAKELLLILKEARSIKWMNIFTGDESMFILHYSTKGAWVEWDEKPPESEQTKIQTLKIMITVIWGVSGICVLDMLPHDTTFNSEYFINNIVNEFVSCKAVQRVRTSHRKVWLHLDNCRVHNSKESNECFKANNIHRAPHPPYSPDIAPSDFFLFGYTKDKLKGRRFKSPDDIFEEIHSIISHISKEKLISVYTNWIKRCKRVIELNGDYFDKD